MTNHHHTLKKSHNHQSRNPAFKTHLAQLPTAIPTMTLQCDPILENAETLCHVISKIPSPHTFPKESPPDIDSIANTLAHMILTQSKWWGYRKGRGVAHHRTSWVDFDRCPDYAPIRPPPPPRLDLDHWYILQKYSRRTVTTGDHNVDEKGMVLSYLHRSRHPTAPIAHHSHHLSNSLLDMDIVTNGQGLERGRVIMNGIGWSL